MARRVLAYAMPSIYISSVYSPYPSTFSRTSRRGTLLPTAQDSPDSGILPFLSSLAASLTASTILT